MEQHTSNLVNLGLSGSCITEGPQPWQVLQRGDDGCASLSITGSWNPPSKGTHDVAHYRVEVRVAYEDDNRSVAGCDWREADMLESRCWQIRLRVPTGGLYRIETRLFNGVNWRHNGERIPHISVGDVWLLRILPRWVFHCSALTNNGD